MGSNHARNLDPGNALPKLALILAWLPAALRADGEDSIAFFESKIRPLLIEHCLECHSTDTKQKGGLLLDSRAGWETGGDNGPAAVPGDPAQSLLIKAVTWTDKDLQMPPKRKLAESEIAALTEWIKRGARDFLHDLNTLHLRQHPGEDVLEARIANYELAAHMQLEAARLLDLTGESAATRKLYGLDRPETAAYGARCLMARRLIEAGVRYVQVFPPLKPSFQPWDHHSSLKSGLQSICAQTDQPSAALIQDLKQRGLLEDVIVMWTGEFGRLPITEGADGRDHNRNAFSLLMAGGGFRGGHIHGATDDFGYKSVERRVSVPDLHATILNQLGLDHTRLTYLHNGRPERLTDPEVTGARIVREILG